MRIRRFMVGSDAIDSEDVTKAAASSAVGGLIPLIARDSARVMLTLGRGGCGLVTPETSIPTVEAFPFWSRDSSISVVERVSPWFIAN